MINNYKAKYEGKNIKLYNMDCIDLLKQCENNSFDLAIIDPPYGINFAKSHTGKGWVTRETKSWDKEIPKEEYWKELFRVSKNQIVWGANYMTTFLPPSQGWIFWDKGQRNFSLADGELAYSSFDKAMRVFTFSRGEMQSEYKGKKFHPTTKPVALYKWILKNYAKPNDKILDTHLGSGSIAVACENGIIIDNETVKFNLTGCELDEEYFDNMCKRIEAETQQLTLF